MNVLVVSAFPPEPSPEANHALHISEHLADSGATIHVLCRKGSIAATHDNIFVHPVVDDWSWSDLPKVVNCIRECRPDVVLLLYIGFVYHHNPMITFLPTICKKLLNGISCVTQFENPDDVFSDRPFAGRALRNAMALWAGRRDIHQAWGTLLRDSTRIIALSSPHRDRLARHHRGMAEKMVILPPPPLIRVCTDQPATVRQQVRDAIGAAERDFVFIYWGYIYRGKGVETLLEAFRIVCRRNENVRLVLVGGSLEIPHYSGSDYFQTVRQLPEKLGIADKVTWTGPFNWDSDEGSRYLHAGDACILPFDYGVTLNNSSLAAATTHGLPIIGTDQSMWAWLSGQPDEALEHGRNIYLCRPKDPQALAEAMQQLIENPDFHERLRIGSRELARDWHCWERMTKRLVEILKTEISDRKSPSEDGPESFEWISKATTQTPYDSSSTLTPGRPTDQHTLSVTRTPLRPSLSGPVSSLDDSSAPLVSVILPVYNVAKYLSQCLDSLVNQTLKHFEIIVVNDASTDNSLEIIKEYQSRYVNLQLIDCQTNLGPASARNLAMRVATGTYIGFIDGDDWADIHKYELMYRRAERDGADIVFAGIRSFIHDDKYFGDANDQRFWDEVRPELKRRAFHPREEPRVFMMEPSIWAKLYRRSFLLEHGLEFEEGRNSVEDFIFHFDVLWKANRISLLDQPLAFYRWNRPGQITGRTDRRIFETIDCFQKIAEKLAARGASIDIWAGLLLREFRFFEWMLLDRVPDHSKSAFFSACAKNLRNIPAAVFRRLARQADSDELAKLFCMRRNWLYAYEQVARHRWPLFPLLNVLLHERWHGVLKRGVQHGWGMLRRRVISFVRSLVNKSLHSEGVEKAFRTVDDRLNQLTQTLALQRGEPLVETCRINDQMLFLSRPANSGLGDAVWRTENDYYLFQTAVFREGDTVVDVGAHLGISAIYLAKKFPFITVYALEPEPNNYDCLQRNIALNGVTNVVAINKALSGDGETKTLYSDPLNSTWATIDATVASSRHLLQASQIETVTLADLFREYDIQQCRMLKISALGAVRKSLEAFSEQGRIDSLCGEVSLEDCSKVRLEVVSWRIARQHFWRTTARQANGTLHAWLHQMPAGIEQSPIDCSRPQALASYR